MNSIFLRSLFFCLGFGLLAMAAPTRTYIKDDAKFFSKEAVALMNVEIAAMQKNLNRVVTIETVQAIPMSKNRTPEMEAGTQPDPVFSAWAKERLDRTGEHNIYLVIARNPSYIMAAVGNQARSTGEFSETDRNALIKILADHFQARQYDRALVDGLHFVQDAIRANRAGTPITAANPAGSPGPAISTANPDVTFLWRWIGFGCAGLLAVLLIVGLVRGYKAPVVLTKADETTA